MAGVPGLSHALLLLSLLPTPALLLTVGVTQLVLPPDVQVLDTGPHTAFYTILNFTDYFDCKKEVYLSLLGKQSKKKTD